MIDLHYWPTPNGWKISIALEEMELPYATKRVDIGRGDPVSISESVAILLYRAEKSGEFLPSDIRGIDFDDPPNTRVGLGR